MCMRQDNRLEIRRHGTSPGHAWIPCGFERNYLTSFYLGILVILKNDENTGQKDLGVQIPSLSSSSCVNVGKSLNFSDPRRK